MSTVNRSSFVYVTFIRTTPEKLWEALTNPQFTRQYWFDTTVECGWKKGSPWKLIGSDGTHRRQTSVSVVGRGSLSRATAIHLQHLQPVSSSSPPAPPPAACPPHAASCEQTFSRSRQTFWMQAPQSQSASPLHVRRSQ